MYPGLVRLGILAIVFALGCAASAKGTIAVQMVVYHEPPAPRMEPAPEARDGFVWTAGHWTSSEDQWTWVDGKYEPSRPGYTWLDGRWERRGSAWHWVAGTWTVSSTAP